MIAAVFDTRPVQDTAVGSLAAQRAIHQVREGADPEVLWDALLEVVDAHGLHSVAAAAFVREVGKRLR